MFKNLFQKNAKIGGIIGYLSLESFWLSCTVDEQNALTRYYQNGLSTAPNTSPIVGNITFSSDTKLKYLSSMIGWAVSEKNFDLADKIINAGNTLVIDSTMLLDAHYFWQEAAECYYKQRDIRSDAIDLTIRFCQTDVKMFPEYRKPMMKEFGCIPRITTFQRLAIIYEKDKQYAKAIEICKLAIKYELSDSTKGGYPARIEKLEKKLGV